MAWSWSHSAEGLENARRNLRAAPVEDLRVMFAEFRAAQLRKPRYGSRWDDNHFHERRYEKALAFAATLPDDVLAAQVWEWAEELCTCDNGGAALWTCPSGCHTVGLDLTEEAEQLGELC